MVSDENQFTKTSTGAAACSEEDKLHSDTTHGVANTMDPCVRSSFMETETAIKGGNTFCGFLCFA